MDEQHIGKLVVATVQDLTADSSYKIRARIDTGDLAGNECFVAYNGLHNLLSRRIVIRMDTPMRNPPTRLNLEGELTGNFITQNVPEGFDSALSNEVILYGLLEERMKRYPLQTPYLGMILNFYNPGYMFRLIYYALENGRVTPYNITPLGPEKMMNEGERIKNAGNALRYYLSKTNRKSRNPISTVRLVIVEENVNLERMILLELQQTGLRIMQMEPQR